MKVSATAGIRTLDLRIGIPALNYWAKWTWAIYWHAHIHFIVNRGVWMTPNILPVSNSSRIGWILPTARTKPPWCPHHFILSFYYSHKHLPSKINTAFHVFVGCRCIPVTHPSTNATKRNKFYTYFWSDRQRKSYHRCVGAGLGYTKSNNQWNI